MKKPRRPKPPAERLPRGATRGTLFFEVARIRHRDATELLRIARYNCAIYIIGYAIECSLKGAVAVRRGDTYLEEQFEHHNWDKLLDAAGLTNSLNSNPTLKSVYSAVADQWHPSLRYSTAVYGRTQAESLHSQFTAVFEWIRETTI